MTIAEKKKRMKRFEDFYGGELISIDDIDEAKTNKDLCILFKRHFRFLEHQQIDALTHLENFKESLGLFL